MMDKKAWYPHSGGAETPHFNRSVKMKNMCILLAVVGLMIAAMSVTVQATPEIAERTDKACGDCHSGGRHHGK